MCCGATVASTLSVPLLSGFSGVLVDTSLLGACVELESECRDDAQPPITAGLLEIGSKFEITRGIQRILFHPAFPVDIRHNAKIFREKLAVWAQAQTK